MSAKISLTCDSCNPSMKEIENKAVHPGYFATMEVETVVEAQFVASEEGWSGDEYEDMCASCTRDNVAREQDDLNVEDDSLGLEGLGALGEEIQGIVQQKQTEDQKALEALDEAAHLARKGTLL